METLWYALVSVMMAVYVALDGFDFGAGIVHQFVAKTDEERRTVLNAIGPIWDGNEVWLLAAGGILFFAFPRVYATGFSGFYLPLMMVLWLLILRGTSIEFRSHVEGPLWRSFWDGVFTFASSLMAVVLGAALGNVIRGVPVNQAGYFVGPLFTNFLPGAHPGVLDWYTVLTGLFATAVLAGHGALYLVWKTTGAVQERSRKLATKAWIIAIVLGVLVTLATADIHPGFYGRLISRPWTWVLVLLVIGSLPLIFRQLQRGQELAAFLASAAFIVAMLAGAAVAMYPNMLVSTINPSYSLTAFNAAAGQTGLKAGIVWWPIGMLLAAGYFTYIFRTTRGKVVLDPEGHGY